MLSGRGGRQRLPPSRPRPGPARTGPGRSGSALARPSSCCTEPRPRVRWAFISIPSSEVDPSSLSRPLWRSGQERGGQRAGAAPLHHGAGGHKEEEEVGGLLRGRVAEGPPGSKIHQQGTSGASFGESLQRAAPSRLGRPRRCAAKSRDLPLVSLSSSRSRASRSASGSSSRSRTLSFTRLSTHFVFTHQLNHTTLFQPSTTTRTLSSPVQQHPWQGSLISIYPGNELQ